MEGGALPDSYPDKAQSAYIDGYAHILFYLQNLFPFLIFSVGLNYQKSGSLCGSGQ